MLFVDQLKKDDLQLRWLAALLLAGLLILLAGLWYVQVVSGRMFENHLEVQSYRTVRVSAVRGKILDNTGQNVLAESRPRYNLCLYLDKLQPDFRAAYSGVGKHEKNPLVELEPYLPAGFVPLKTQAEAAQKARIQAQEKRLGRSLTKAELKQFGLTAAQRQWLGEQARLQVAAAVVAEVSRRIGQNIVLDPVKFERAYATRLAMPFPILTALTTGQIARFEENYTNVWAGLDLESERFYPLGTTAAHLLGSVKRDDSSDIGEDAYFSYRLPDYSGISGIEAKYNDLLRGVAGTESVLVNNYGYRQSETMWTEPQPGHNVVLTLDLDIQRAAEEAMLHHQGPDVRGAVVVLDVRTGDVLAMVSSPSINPDFTQNNPTRLNDPVLRPEINRALQENLAPGSIFKTVVAIASLESGLNPNEIYHVDPNPLKPTHGCYHLGSRVIRDEAPPGDYSFKKAFIHSSNSYFVNCGLRAGAENIVRVGKEFHLGERTGLFASQETRGNFPTLSQVQDSDWRAGETANLCIGQGDIDVTPMQMAVMVAAIANGGYVLWPRLVQRIEPMQPTTGESVTNFPAGVIRDRVNIHPRNLNLLRAAMLADVEEKDGTGTAAAVPGMTICGKTGTAQVQDSTGRETGRNLWFASYAPYDRPHYAVVVMVQSGTEGFGGTICAPIAHDIYAAIQNKDHPAAAPVRVIAAAIHR